MVKWLSVTHNQYIGFFAPGIAFFILQQLPYIIMPLVQMESNLIMEMQDKSALLNAMEKILGVSCVIILLFLVRGDANWFSFNTKKEIAFFSIVILAIIVYFIGWVLYFRGCHSLLFMLGTLVAMPPIYSMRSLDYGAGITFSR